MPRGGYRGGHRPGNFSNMPTTVIRVPQSLAEVLLKVAHKLDRNEPIGIVQKLKLPGVKVYKLHKQDVVKVIDIMRCGYDIDWE